MSNADKIMHSRAAI